MYKGADLTNALLISADLTGVFLTNAHLNGARPIGTHLGDAHLDGADLTGAYLNGATLTGAYLFNATLINAALTGAKLTGVKLNDANLSGAYLGIANLSGAGLSRAILRSADLSYATLTDTYLQEAHLEGADLTNAHLEGADFSKAYLEGADLRSAWLDSKTVLSKATLDTTTRLGDIQWSGVGAVNLTQIDWEQVPSLGDEHGVGRHTDASVHEAAVRAYRQLAAQLRAQGVSEVADRFAYRAQVCQRGVFRRKHQWAGWVLQTLLAVLAGYGFRLWRIFAAYLFVLTIFAALYFVLGLPKTQDVSTLNRAGDAFLVSLTAIHGRVFLEQLGQYSAQAWVAAVESVVGIVIEGVFVAMLIQRFFGAK